GRRHQKDGRHPRTVGRQGNSPGRDRLTLNPLPFLQHHPQPMTATQPRQPPSRLAKFPSHFNYAVASGQERDAFLLIVAELLAEERVRGLQAREELETLIVTARAHQLRATLDNTRKKTQAALEAREYLAQSDVAVLTRQ